ncbi:uncharacterized protein LOC108678475 isoform X2 [Hyalella azteca]|uniref:Uncharacterized protein LOC108678475 isoform X1 n=1 Tax=Hyalella azteca TaxID=294128 RepID=A0A979FQH2_HYAAZ|nr:uncharacterized protein LOC108678475 isoform X1 [Hyalella azteca]XP_047739353.1 uncharacterized protein LOC108678475 isoform X2 [Hyalella azteca]
MEASTKLLVNTPPSWVDISGVPPTITAGDKLRVWCSAPHARPSPVLVWAIARKGKPVRVLAQQELRERNVSRSWQDVQVEWQDHGASLTCTAYSPALPAVRVSNSSVLSVTFAPRVRLSLGAMLSPEHIKEGSDVYFRCDIHSNPPPNRIAWFHNGQEVHADDRVLVSGDHLVLQKVHRKWSGNFACSASNPMGEAMSNSLEIAIQYSPVCGRTRPVLYRAALGQHVTLLCAVLANPTNVTFQWAFTNAVSQTLPSPGYGLSSSSLMTTSLPPPGITGGVRSVHGLEGRLKYQLQRVQDYGSVECRATNSVGSQAIPCVFTVRPPGIPSSNFGCKVTKQTWASVEIACALSSSYTNDDSENVTDDAAVNTAANANWNMAANADENTVGSKKLLDHIQMKNVAGSAENSIQNKVPSKHADHKWTTLEKDALGVKAWNGKELRLVEDHDQSAELRADELQQQNQPQTGAGDAKILDADAPDDTEYLLTVRERNTNTLMHNTTGARGVFNLTGLTPGADYVIRVWRVNRRGRSAPLTLETFTLRTAENRMREDVVSDAAAVVLGSVLTATALLLVLALSVVLITRRNRHATAARAQFLQSTVTLDQESPSTLIPPGEGPSQSVVPLVHQIAEDAPDLLGEERKTPSGASAGLEGDDVFLVADHCYQASSSLYSGLTPVSPVNMSNSSTLRKMPDGSESCGRIPRAENLVDQTGKQTHYLPRRESLCEYSSTGYSSPGLVSPTAALNEGEASDSLRDLERQRGVGIPGRVARSRNPDHRAHYVRSQQLTQVAQERESFL